MASVQNESGAALVIALLLMMVMITLVPTAMQLTTGEMDRTANFTDSRELFYLAEAGLEHSKSLVETVGVKSVLAGPDNAVSTTPSDSVNDDNGTFNVGTQTSLNGNEYSAVPFNGKTYYIRAFDNDDGDLDPTIDTDGLIFLSAVGIADNSTATVQSLVHNPPTTAPGALNVTGDFDISGNTTISGACGDVHTNGDVTLSGILNVSQDFTSSGAYNDSASDTIGGDSGGGFNDVPVPLIDPTEFEQYADYKLASDGFVYDGAGNFVHDANVNTTGTKWNNWHYELLKPGEWLLKGNTLDASFYVDGNLMTKGVQGSVGNPWMTTLTATGSIEITGTSMSANLRDPNDPIGIQNSFMVAGTDIEMSGNSNQTIDGIIWAGEQINLNGDPNILGSVMAYGNPSVSTLVTSSEISGDVNITYGCGMTIPGTSLEINVVSWNEVD